MSEDAVNDLARWMRKHVATEVAWAPNPGRQHEFISSAEREVLYGGAAGGGKSDALLASAAMHYKHQHMRSILFRRTYGELRDLVRRSHEIYPSLGGSYRESTREWFFPDGGIIEFGYLKRSQDRYNYQGRQFNFIGWDELTQWPDETSYVYLLSRLRAPKFALDEGLTLRCRATTNPGGIGHSWVKKRWGIPDAGGPSKIWDRDGKWWRIFIPARINDNPWLANTTYERDLNAMSERWRKMLRDGRWDVLEGVMFTEWDPRAHVCDPFPIPRGTKMWRSMDDGFNAPACVLWFAKIDQRVFVIAELYRSGLTAEEISGMITNRDESMPTIHDGAIQPHGMLLDGIIDSAAYTDTGIKRFRGQSRAKEMNELGCGWRACHKGANSRVQGCNMVHELLSKRLADGLPALMVFSNCVNLIRTLPALPIDELNKEDVDTAAEDHAYDALRYGLQGIPQMIQRRKLSGT